MPYNSVSDIPSRVKQALTSEHQQRAWLEAFNSASKQGHDEQTCFKIAWSAAKKAHRTKKD